jgi:hypothetical protein
MHLVIPEKVVKAVGPDGVQAGIAEEDFQRAPGCRVFNEYCLDIFLYPEHLNISFSFFQEGDCIDSYFNYTLFKK